MQAVLMAVWQRLDRTPVIPHSNRGCKFTLAASYITYSMSAIGSCANNGAVESSFGMLKRER